MHFRTHMHFLEKFTNLLLIKILHTWLILCLNTLTLSAQSHFLLSTDESSRVLGSERERGGLGKDIGRVYITCSFADPPPVQIYPIKFQHF